MKKEIKMSNHLFPQYNNIRDSDISGYQLLIIGRFRDNLIQNNETLPELEREIISNYNLIPDDQKDEEYTRLLNLTYQNMF